MTTAALDRDPPAVAGGSPAKTTPYRQERRYGEEELAELREALEQGTLFYAQGQKVKALEKAFAESVGAAHAIACSSGTAAIHSALIAAGVSPGDEVIVTPITDMGSIAPILYQGAIPVFADLDPHTYNIAPTSVAARITPRTRAILAVHLAGNACDLRALKKIADRHGLLLIEDCAQAHGARYEGRAVGTWGQIGCYSYNEFKHISCGDGGVVVTEDAALAKKLRLATDKCYDRSPDALVRQPVFLANNYRMTELQGAVALAQLRKLPSIVQRRRDWCGALNERLRDVPGISLPQVTSGCDPSWWFYLMRVKPQTLRADADRLAEALRAEGLPVSAHYIGNCLYEYPIFTQHSAFERGEHPYAAYPYARGKCPEAEAILETGVMLAVKESYSDADLEETIYAIRRVARWFAGQ